MDFASIQAQLANLTSQLSQIAERTTMQSVPTFGASYRQGYQANLYPQSDWSDHSNSMWWEAQQVQHKAYWQPYEEFYSRPMQPPQPHIQYAQSNLGSSIDYNQILNELNSLLQGSQNQAKEDQQGGYWQQEEEFYHLPYELSHPSQQFAQFNSGTSLDNDMFNKLLTSLYQEVENRNKEMPIQTKKTGELEKHIGQIMEFMAQIQEQSEVSNSTIEKSKEDFEIHDAITLGSAMEVGAKPRASKQSQEEDEHLLIEEEEEDTPTARVEQPLPQPPRVPMPSNSGKLVPNSILSYPIPPNVPFPRRFLIPKEEESEKDIVEALPKVQSDIPILGTPKQVPDCVEIPEENCTPRRRIQEKKVAREYLEFIKEHVLETTIPKEVEFDDTGQITTIVVNLAKFKVPETFKEVVFVIEFLSDKASKSPSAISITFYTYMLLMIQAPTLEFKPLPDHFKYHLPFKDQFHAMGPRGA
ncbi:hypothetical protein FF1_032372 [Malus domestica]